MFEKFNTLIEIMYNSQKYYGNNVFLKYRENENYNTITYNQFVKIVENLSAGFLDLGIKKNDKVGIISENMHKWLIADMAIICLGAIDVPRGSDSTIQEISYILKHSDSKYCIVENPKQADKILEIKKELPKIKYIILLTGKIKELNKKNTRGIKIFLLDDLIIKGEKLYKKYEKKLNSIKKSIKTSDIVTLIYTSGTTGTPKGVMLSHKNILQNIKSLPDLFKIVLGGERWLSVLPVWHVFERTLEYIIMATTGTMLYSKPVSKFLLPDFIELKPTFMVAVPRIYEALYQGIVSKIKNSSKIKWFLFNFFLNIGITYKRAYKILKNQEPLFEKPFLLISFFKKITSSIIFLFLWPLYTLGNILVFKAIKEKTGGSLRFPISGGGALPEKVDNFFCAIGLELMEGWGLTETAPVIGVRTFERSVPRTVGAPSHGVKLFICDEKGKPLKNQHERGIVFIKGDNVMSGYYKDPKQTKNVILKNGWFNTGDIGRLTISGELQLTGRAKDTIVLTGGENIEPAPIEDKLLNSPMIDQIMVVGQDKKVLGALIVPNEENLKEFAQKNSITYKNYQELLKNQKIIDEFRRIIKSIINFKNGFKDYEMITSITLIPKPFEVGLELTHSLKMKRNVIAEKYKKEIDIMLK